MIRLAVATDAETFERMQAPMAARAIDVAHLDVEERAIDLAPSADPWGAGPFDVGYIYPSRLMEGAVADALLDLTWVNDRDAVLRSRNKAGVLAELARAGIPVPASVLVSNPVEEATLTSVFDRFDGPVVVKPNSSTRGVGVARAADVDSFLGITDYLALVHDFSATGDKSFLVQEFVSDARDLRVMVLDGRYAGAVERHVSPEPGDRWKHNVHRGANATAVTPSVEVRELAERVADHLSIPVLGVDFLVTEDEVIVSETNARPTIDAEEKYEDDFYDRLAGLVRDAADGGDA